MIEVKMKQKANLTSLSEHFNTIEIFPFFYHRSMTSIMIEVMNLAATNTIHTNFFIKNSSRNLPTTGRYKSRSSSRDRSRRERVCVFLFFRKESGESEKERKGERKEVNLHSILIEMEDTAPHLPERICISIFLMFKTGQGIRPQSLVDRGKHSDPGRVQKIKE